MNTGNNDNTTNTSRRRLLTRTASAITTSTMDTFKSNENVLQIDDSTTVTAESTQVDQLYASPLPSPVKGRSFIDANKQKIFQFDMTLLLQDKDEQEEGQSDQPDLHRKHTDKHTNSLFDQVFDSDMDDDSTSLMEDFLEASQAMESLMMRSRKSDRSSSHSRSTCGAAAMDVSDISITGAFGGDPIRIQETDMVAPSTKSSRKAPRRKLLAERGTLERHNSSPMLISSSSSVTSLSSHKRISHRQEGGEPINPRLRRSAGLTRQASFKPLLEQKRKEQDAKKQRRKLREQQESNHGRRNSLESSTSKQSHSHSPKKTKKISRKSSMRRLSLGMIVPGTS